MPFIRIFLGLVAPLFFLEAAYASEICVAIDTERDNLSEGDRKAVLMLAKQEIEEAGYRIISQGCEDEIVLSSVKIGTSVTLSATRGDDQRRLVAQGLDDIPNVCSQIIKSLLSGEPLALSMDRTNVTKGQAEPKREKADFLTMFRGGAMVHTVGVPVGPNLGVGMRVELDNWAIEAESAFGFSLSDHASRSDNGGSFSFGAHLGGLYFFDGESSHSAFAGLGVGYGTTALVTKSTDLWTGAGFDFKVSLGYEILRASTIRMFIQTEALIPTYQLGADSGNLDKTDRYNPSYMISFGIGYVPDVVVGGFLFN